MCLTHPLSYLLLLLYAVTGSLLMLCVRSMECAAEPTPNRRMGRLVPRQPLPPGAHARYQLASALFVVVSQGIAMLSKTEVTRAQEPRDTRDAVSVLLVLGSLVICSACFPSVFERYRIQIVSVARVAVFALPNTRNPRGIQHVFQALPSTRSLGILRDFWTLMLGTRGLAMLCTPIACPLPLLPHMAVALFALQRVHTAEYMCSCNMLLHPIFQSRISSVHAAIRKLLMLVPERHRSCAPAAEAALDCRVFLTFFQMLVGFVLPTIMVAKVHAPLRAAEAAQEAFLEQQLRRRQRRLTRRGSSDSSGSGGSRAGVSATTTASGGNGGPLSLRKWPLPPPAAWYRWACRVASKVDSFFHHLCDILTAASVPALVAVAAWALLLNLLWLVALLVEHPGAVLDGLPSLPEALDTAAAGNASAAASIGA